MLLKEINHTQCAIDQSHQVTAEGSLASPAFFGQQDAETVATRGGHRSGSGTLCGVGNICLRNMEKPLFLILVLEPQIMYLGPLGCQGQYCEQLRKGNMLPSFAIISAHLYPGRKRARPAEHLTRKACPHSKANSGLFAHETMQEFII